MDVRTVTAITRQASVAAVATIAYIKFTTSIVRQIMQKKYMTVGKCYFIMYVNIPICTHPNYYVLLNMSGLFLKTSLIIIFSP